MTNPVERAYSQMRASGAAAPTEDLADVDGPGKLGREEVHEARGEVLIEQQAGRHARNR